MSVWSATAATVTSWAYTELSKTSPSVSWYITRRKRRRLVAIKPWVPDCLSVCLSGRPSVCLCLSDCLTLVVGPLRPYLGSVDYNWCVWVRSVFFSLFVSSLDSVDFFFFFFFFEFNVSLQQSVVEMLWHKQQQRQPRSGPSSFSIRRPIPPCSCRRRRRRLRHTITWRLDLLLAVSIHSASHNSQVVADFFFSSPLFFLSQNKIAASAPPLFFFWL